MGIEPQSLPLDDAPRCGKCGAPITTGAMAMLCPFGRQCEFVDDDEHWAIVEEFRSLRINNG